LRMKAPTPKTIGILGVATVVAFVIALGTFDVYLAVLAQVLLLATVVVGVLAIVGASRSRGHQH
jgi:uncharacterized membrane protein HdeD (DUF308 family)